MPFAEPNTDLELAKTSTTPNPAAPEGPSVLDVAAAAERSSNLAGTLYDTITNAAPNPHVKPGFDPAVSIPKGYEAQAELFHDVHSPEDMEYRRQQIDRENADKETIARAGGWGLAATMAAGFTDPLTIASMAIPVAAPTRLAQAGKFALTAGATTAAQELAMQQLQVTRTPQESLLNVGAATVLGGVLGSVFRPHVEKPEFDRMAQTLHSELNDPRVPGETVLGPADGHGRIVPESEITTVPLPARESAETASSDLTEKFRNELTADHAEAVERYRALNDSRIADTQNGKILNVDMARELSPEYAADRTLSADVHEPSSEFVKKMYAERLAEAPKAGENNMVMFTAGGTGAGKTTAISAIPEVKAMADHAQIIYDTNMNSLANSTQKIDQAIAAGKDVHVNYVYRDPLEALTKGALPRAERMGRTVPLKNHAETHAGSFETIKKLQAKYANDSGVSFSIIDNSRGKGNAALSSMENLEGKRYTVTPEELRNALDSERQAGRISDATYRGTAGNAAAAESQRRIPGQDRPVAGAEPQPQRAQERPLESGLPDVPLTIGEQHVNPSGESTAGASAASSPTMRGETIARGARTLVEGPVGRVSPGGRLMGSPSIESRKLLQELANLPETTEKNYGGIASPSPVERELWKYEGVHYQGMRARGAQYRAYRERLAATGERPLARDDFGHEIAYAMRRSDQSPIPEVAEAARQTRAIEFEPLKQRAIKAGLLPEDVKASGADSYLMRQYDARKIAANLTDWTNRLKAGFMHQGVDAAEAGDIAHQATRNVLGSERGTMDWKTMDGIVPESGQLKERTLKLPDSLLEPYLNNDIDHVAHSYLRSMAPEVEMHERFGSRDLKDQLADVRDDYARMIERASDDQAKQDLQGRMDNDLRDLTAVRDRLYGIYGQPKDPGAFFVRAGRLLRSENALRLLGAATLSHFPDLANVMMRYGLPNTMAAIAKALTSKEVFNLAREEAKRMGAALDMTMNVTASLLGDYGSHSRYAEQRVANKLTRSFTILTGETPLITAVQALTSTMAQDELIRTAQAVARGQSIDGNLLARTAAAGIDRDMLARIAAQHEQFGAEVRGLNFGMSDQWTDQAAAKAFESAVLRDAHSVTLRPGAGDTPLLMSTEIGKSLLQFKSFGYAASRSVLNPMMQGLAHGDPRAAQALLALVGMGTATYVAKQKAAGQPLEPFGSPRLALEVIDKANLMGWMSEFIFPLLWQAGIKNVSRFGDRDAVETIGGPTAGTIASTYERRLPQKLAGNQTDKAETFSRSDLHFLRRLAPGQNLWYFRNAINSMEDRIGDAFDLPGKSNADRAAENAAGATN